MTKLNFKLVIADDHPLLLAGMVSILQKEFKYANIFKAKNGQIALDKIKSIQPDIAILDIDMPILTGFEVAKAIKKLKLKTKIIFLTLHKEQSLFNEAQKLDLDAYILKEFSTNEIVKCVQQVLLGNKYYSEQLEKFILKSTFDFSVFTKKEESIIKLIAQHKSTKEIAEMLFITTRTVETHKYHICKKLNLKPEKNALLKWVLEQQF
jgi:DNA-binding NarL/FixJ family response regulator